MQHRGGAGFVTPNKIYGITAFMLNGMYRNMPVSEDNCLILEHKVSFGLVPYPPSVQIY